MANPERPSSEMGWRDSPYWADKGNPKEQFDVAFGERRLDVVNFSEVKLSEKQLDDLSEIISKFAQIKNGKCFDKVRSILIDNEQPIDPETGVGVNGMGAEKGDGIVKLYPRALQPISHRVPGVSNFEGTTIHEFTHGLVDKATSDEWKKRFGWTVNEDKLEKIKRMGIMQELQNTPRKDWEKFYPGISKLVRVWQVEDPDRCVTDYAKLGPDDDIADSMVAAIKDPRELDRRKKLFLDAKYLSDIDEKTAPEVNIQRRAEF